MLKSFTIRIYPTKEQEQKIWKHIDACRYIWNLMIDVQKKNYEAGNKLLSGYKMMGLLTPLKQDGEHDWLYEVSNHSLQNTCRDLDKAYSSFLKKHTKYPKYKSRKKRKKISYPVHSENFYFKDEKYLNIEKVGKVKYKTDFIFVKGRKKIKVYNVRIIQRNQKWLLFLNMECENQAQKVLTNGNMGIDLGLKTTAVVKFGESKYVFPNINKSKKVKKLEKKVAYLQRVLSRKYRQNKKGCIYLKTKNIKKVEIKLRKTYSHLIGIRDNYCHQLTHFLVNLSPKRVVMEDLNLMGLMKNRHISKAFVDQRLGYIISYMKYKCEWAGIEFIQADRFYPSSKICSRCNHKKQKLGLNERIFKCENCGYEIDRDYNAAVNLSRQIT